MVTGTVEDNHLAEEEEFWLIGVVEGFCGMSAIFSGWHDIFVCLRMERLLRLESGRLSSC